MQLCVTTNKENMVFTKNKEKIIVNKNININIDSYPISMAISIVPNIVDIDIEIEILLTPEIHGSGGKTNVLRHGESFGTIFEGLRLT